MKYLSTSIIFIIILLLTFSSCEKKEVRLIKGTWDIVNFTQNDTTIDVSPYNYYLSFEKNNLISGRICNLVFGEYYLTDGVINISLFVSTEMGCVPSFEEPLIELGNETKSHSINQDTLTLFCSTNSWIQLVKQDN